MESEFPAFKLKYLAQIEMGQSLVSEEYSFTPEEGIPFLQGTADFTDLYPEPRVFCLTAHKKAQAGDILFSVRAPIGRINIADQTYGIGRGLCAVRARKSLDARYAWWALHGIRHELNVLATGSTYEAVTIEDVSNLEIPLPPLKQQKELALLLDRKTARLDALVAIKQEQLALIAEKRRALISRAVTQGLDRKISRKVTGFPWLGETPEHWEICILKRKLTSLDYGISESVSPDGNIGVLRMGDIKNGEVVFDKLGFVDEVDDKLLLKTDDLLFNRTNSLDQVGKVGIFRGHEDYPISFASYLVRLRCNEDLLPEFLNYLLNSDGILEWARAEALPSIGQANLSPTRYGYLTIAVPSLAEQHQIVKYISNEIVKLNNLREMTEASLTLLHERRVALITSGITGKLLIDA